MAERFKQGTDLVGFINSANLFTSKSTMTPKDEL